MAGEKNKIEFIISGFLTDDFFFTRLIYLDVQVSNILLVYEGECLQNLLEKPHDVVLERHHVFVENGLEITTGSAAMMNKITLLPWR